MESLTLTIIRRVRASFHTYGDFTEREYVVITKFLDILIDELEKTHGPRPSLSPPPPTNPRKVSGN